MKPILFAAWLKGEDNNTRKIQNLLSHGEDIVSISQYETC
jgi:hypothetical protein